MAEEDQTSLHTYSNISLGGKQGGLPGTLKMNKTGVAWKSKGGKSVAIYANEITNAEWQRTGRFFQLKLILQAGSSVRFDGFREQDLTQLQEFLSSAFKTEIKKVALDTKGVNYGKLELAGNTLSFVVEEKQMFELPVTDVAQCVIPSKNELAVEFHSDDTSLALESDVLVEMRFFVPPTAEETDPATALHDKILEKADLSEAAGGGIVSFDQMLALTPRGRYDIEMCPTFMKLHGKTYDYKVLYSSISRLYQLPKPDGRHEFFVVSLDPPIRQGQTRHPHLVLQLSKDEELEVEINLPEEVMAEKYQGKLQKKMSGPFYNVLCQIFKALTGKKITIPGSFRSHAGHSCIKSSIRASEGWLYPLENSFFFIYKPATHIRFDEIGTVQFARVSTDAGSANRTFDLIVNLKAGTSVQFTSIQRQEYSNLFNFITSKGLKIVTPDGTAVTEPDELGGGDDQPDQTAITLLADDEDSEEDEDFVAQDEDDVDEEFDSGGEPDDQADSEGDEDEPKEPKEKSKKDKSKGKPKDKTKEKGKEKEKEKGKAKEKGKEKEKPKDKSKEKTKDAELDKPKDTGDKVTSQKRRATSPPKETKKTKTSE